MIAFRMSHPMKTRAFLGTMLAACAFVVSGCSSPAVKVAPREPEPSWVDAGTPASTVHMEREIRYYVDEQGMVWDDRGKKHGPAP